MRTADPQLEGPIYLSILKEFFSVSRAKYYIKFMVKKVIVGFEKLAKFFNFPESVQIGAARQDTSASVEFTVFDPNNKLPVDAVIEGTTWKIPGKKILSELN